MIALLTLPRGPAPESHRFPDDEEPAHGIVIRPGPPPTPARIARGPRLAAIQSAPGSSAATG